MAGGSLKNRLLAGRMSDVEALRVLEDVGGALVYAHGQGEIHRDLKPGNILLDENGKAHVADFGIAKLQEATAELTGTAIVGTPANMSPEQVRGDKELDGRSDQYSLGIIAFEMLTEQKSYEADTSARLMMKHVLEPVPRWSPNGNQLVFQSYADGNWEIYTLKHDNGRLSRLTSNSCADWAPYWSPDSKKIVFYSDCDGNREIYVMNADGSGCRQLTSTGGDAYNWFPTWSRDGRQILFASNRSGKFHVYVMDADGGNQTQLAQGCSPEMSPDRNAILFTQYCTDSGNVLIMDTNGRNVQTL
jgi:serine/threonine protein kinase